MRCIPRASWCGAFLAAALLAAGGCSPPAKTQPADGGKPAERKKGHAHDHPDEGPNGGALAEWGDEEYHAEFTVDHGKKQATVFILDATARKHAPIQAESVTLTLTNVTPPVQLTLKADPEKDDPPGSASRFRGTHEALAKEMEFKGEISGKAGDKPYAGTFEEEPHEHKGARKKK